MRPFDRQISILGTVAFLVLFSLMSTGLWTAYHLLQHQRDFLSQQNKQVLLAHQLDANLKTQFHLMPAFVLSGDENLLGQFEKVRREFLIHWERLRRAQNDPRSLALLDSLRESEAGAYEVAKRGIQLRLSKAPMDDVNNYFADHAKAATETMESSMAELLKRAQDQNAVARNSLRSTSNRFVMGFAATCVFVFLFLVVGAIMIAKMLRLQRVEEENARLVLEQNKRLAEARKDAIEIVAHDLRNPLASMLMLTELWEHWDGTVDQEKWRSEVPLIRKSAEHMNRLIHNLLDHAKIESGKLALDFSICNLNPMLATAVEALSLIAEQQEVKIDFIDDSTDAGIYCDPGRIEQVVSNLVGNAIKFTPRGGVITVRLFNEGTNICVSVKDTGKGIAQEHLRTIFDKYWQISAKSRRGMGLGLAISKNIVDAHGGSISVESVEGQGTEFVFKLPGREAKLPLARATEALPQPYPNPQ